MKHMETCLPACVAECPMYHCCIVVPPVVEESPSPPRNVRETKRDSFSKRSTDFVDLHFLFRTISSLNFIKFSFPPENLRAFLTCCIAMKHLQNRVILDTVSSNIH